MEKTEAYLYNKKKPYIMEAILQEIRKVFITAAGFRAARKKSLSPSLFLSVYLHICNIYILYVKTCLNIPATLPSDTFCLNGCDVNTAPDPFS